MQGRIAVREPRLMKRLLRFEVFDVLIAMGIASLVTGAMLIMAASTFHTSGRSDVGTIEPGLHHPAAFIGQRSQYCVRRFAAGLWAFVRFSGHDGRTGDHAGFFAP